MQAGNKVEAGEPAMASEPEVLSEIRDGIAWVTLNRPAKRNALSESLMTLLSELLWQADEDNRAHCVVLRAAGPDFHSGYDLQQHDQPIAGAVAHRRGRARLDDDGWHQERMQRLRMALFDLDAPSHSRFNETVRMQGLKEAIHQRDAPFGADVIKL